MKLFKKKLNPLYVVIFLMVIFSALNLISLMNN